MVGEMTRQGRRDRCCSVHFGAGTLGRYLHLQHAPNGLIANKIVACGEGGYVLLLLWR